MIPFCPFAFVHLPRLAHDLLVCRSLTAAKEAGRLSFYDSMSRKKCLVREDGCAMSDDGVWCMMSGVCCMMMILCV